MHEFLSHSFPMPTTDEKEREKQSSDMLEGNLFSRMKRLCKRKNKESVVKEKENSQAPSGECIYFPKYYFQYICIIQGVGDGC